MAKVHFLKCRYKNFLSVGNYFVEINLDAHPMNLIVGKNGRGKSTFLEAICFGLFGKSWRGIKKPALVNSINNKDMLVEIEFETGGKPYTIRRGMKPSVLEVYCGGELVNQSASIKDYQSYIEKYILKLNFKSFCQVVLIGTGGFVPFMQLPAASRREVIEDLLDIKVFSSMNLLLKERLSANKQAAVDAEYAVKLTTERIAMKKEHVKTVLKAEKARKERSQKDKDAVIKAIEKLEKSRAAHSEALVTARGELAEIQDANKRLQQFDGMKKQFRTKQKAIEKEQNFFADRAECPQCEQPISDTLKHTKANALKEALANVDAAFEKIERDSARFAALAGKFSSVSAHIADLQSKIYKIDLDISGKRASLASLSEALPPSDVTEDIATIKLLEDELKAKRKEFDRLTHDRSILADAATLLKDNGIKSQILTHYIPIINSLVNQNLEEMDFFVSFELDKDLNEVIKSRHYDDFSYANFSQGEKMRIDLALLMAWRKIASMKNSISTNLLIMDEILDASLDTDGCDLFLEFLRKLSSTTNVFVISHKGDVIYDKFDFTLEAVKVKDFSYLQERY